MAAVAVDAATAYAIVNDAAVDEAAVDSGNE